MKLNYTLRLWPKSSFLIILLIAQSCNKDNDLLSEYVQNNADIGSNFIVDDTYTVAIGQNQLLDVLSNDNFSDNNAVTITSVSNPSIGEVSINENNTITYVAHGSSSDSTPDTTTDTSSDNTPDTSSDTSTDTSSDNTPDTSSDTSTDTSSDNTPDTSSDTTTDTSSDNTPDTTSDTSTDTETVDTFTYTTETTDDEGEITTDTGNVTVVITPEPETETETEIVTGGVNGDNYIYTHQAKVVLKARFENGYVAGSGFNDDISKVISFANSFMANPSQHRPIFGDINGDINKHGHNLHTTAVYAYAIDNIAMANAIATELLGTINSNDLYSSWWNNSYTSRWDAGDDKMWLQCSKAKKMKDSYNFIKNLQTVLSPANKIAIEAWFERFADLAFKAIKYRLDGAFFGAGWDDNNFPNPYYTGMEVGYGRPVQDSNGNDLFIMSRPQDAYNNRTWDVIGYIHSWAVENNDLEKEVYTRNFFKVFLKYGVYPDGTIWEVARNGNSSDTAGISYGWVSSEAAIRIAHTDAMANHFPNDRLYDYKTSDGVINGSTTISDTPYVGTSTTDGVTQKSLLTLIKAQTKYVRSQANGGWNDIRFYGTTPLDATGKSQTSSLVAMANLYYKDQDLKDYYTFNTSVGYPPKQSFGGGYMAGVWDMDAGAWGNLVFGSLWYGQENNFF